MTPGALAGRHVAVVGGGLAGLAAALECADRGARVTLLERRRRLGGLTWSFEHGGLTMDNGQHVFLACCDAYRRFADRIGATADLRPPRPLDIAVIAPDDPPVTGRLRRDDLPAPFHLARSLLTYPHIGWADRARLGPALAALRRIDPADPAHDRVAFGDWLAGRGQSHRAVAALWDLITVPTVNLPSADASLAVAAMVFRTGLLGRRQAADIGWAAVPLGRAHGDRAAGALARAGVAVHTGCRVSAVRPGAGWVVATPGGPLSADAVVVALPHDQAAAVLPPGAAAAQDRWQALGFSAVVDVHLRFDRTVTSEEVLCGHRSLVQWVFDRSRAAGLHDDPAPARAGAGRPQYLAVSLSAADRWLAQPPADLVGSTVAALARLLPAVARARLVDSLVTKERRATFRAAPGSGALRPPALTRHPGLALAGAWTATGWPATMESAVRSGLAAAAALTPDPSLPRTIPLPQEVA